MNMFDQEDANEALSSVWTLNRFTRRLFESVNHLIVHNKQQRVLWLYFWLYLNHTK